MAKRKAVMVEEGTENIILNPSFENDLTSWEGWGAPTIRQVVSDITWHGSKALHLITNTDGQGVRQTLSLTAGATYTVSCWVYVITGRPVIMIARNNDGQVSYLQVVADSSWAGDGKWHRLQLTFVAGDTSNRLYLGKSAAGDIGEYYFDAVQLEAKPYATSFIDGTRSPETLTIPTAGVLNPQEGTVEFIFIPTTQPQTWGRLFQWGEWSNPVTRDDFRIVYGSGWGLNRVRFEIAQANVGQTGVSIVLPSNLQVGKPYYICARWLLPGYIRLTVFDYTNNQVYNASTNTSLAPIFNGYTKAGVGCTSTGAGQTNTLIDDLRISQRARTDEEILAAYREVT